MTEHRLRLLCCWGYSRAGWVAPLEALGADHGFDLTYLFHRRPEEETGVATGWPRRYWLEFRDAQEVLDELRPDRIVFMGLDGAWTIALNAVARRRGIPTFLLQHGIEWPSDYSSAGWGGVHPASASGGEARWSSRLPALRFLVRSLLDRPVTAARTVRLLRASAREGFVHAAPRRTFAARLPSLQLVTGLASALAPVVRDSARAEELCLVGLPELRDLLNADPAPGATPNTVLIIDTPHSGAPNRPVTIPGSTKAAAFRRLGSELRSWGLELRVKLHPYSYGDAWASDEDAVTYLRDVDPRDEIGRAVVVVGFDSTLLLGALQHRPVLIVRVEASWFPDLAAALGAAPILDGLERLTADAVLAARDAGRSSSASALVAAFAGPPPWSTAPLATTVRDPERAPRVDPEDLAAMRSRLRDALGRAGS